MTLEPGRRLGPYQIVELRGKGGMGEVYRARDTRLEREVAIKLLPPELSASPQFRQRLHQEARSVSQLGHPNVCTLFDVGSDAGVDYLVLEYLEGETLEERLRRGPLPLADALRVGAQVARGVGAAHRKHLVHRDLKPGNVMLSSGGAKVLDFGLARIVSTVEPGLDTSSATPAAALTAEGALVGTPHYMSPEQVEGKEADARSDVFALGAVLYEMVSGERPFRGSSQADLIASILRSRPEPLSRRLPLTPARLERLVSRCLEKDPERRWQDAHDVALELESIDADRSGQGAQAAVPRRWLVAPLVGAALLAGLALGLLLDRKVADAVDDDEEPAWTTTELDLPLPRGYLGRMLALAPDGRAVAFISEKGGSRQIYLRRLDSFDITPVGGTEGVEALGWFSPDASTITFRQGRELRSIAALGGNPATLVKDAWSGRFAGDGFLYYSRLQNQATREGTELWRMPVGGGNAELAGHGYVSGSPIPGTRLILTHAPGVGDTRVYWSDVEALDLESGVQRALARGVRPFFVAPGFLVFYRDNAIWAAPLDPLRGELEGEPRPIETRVRGELSFAVDFGAFEVSERGDLLYRSSGAEGAASLVWIGRDGRELGEVTPERRGFESPALSPDGRSLAATVRNAFGSSERWQLELESGSWTRPAQSGLANRETWISDGRETWISDGRETVFSSIYKGYMSSFVQPADGSAPPAPLLEVDFAHLYLDVSPDGRYVLFSPTGSRGLSVYDRESREVRELEPAVFVYSACFHPSGRFLFYAMSLDAANIVSEVWVRPLPGVGEPRQISTGGATEVVCSRDGRETYYRSPTHLIAVPVTVTEDRLRSGRPVALFEDRYLRNQVAGLRNYEVHPDGRFLMVKLAREEDEGKIVLVQNWVAKLRRTFAEAD